MTDAVLTIPDAPERRLAILAAGGGLPPLVAAEARKRGFSPVVFAIAGEADPKSFGSTPVHIVRWGEIGRLFRLADEAGCQEAVFVGSVSKRPDFRTIRPDLGAVKLVPRILQLMRGSDGSLLDGVVHILEEHGLKIRSPLAVAPDLALPQGSLTGEPSEDAMKDIEVAAIAARGVGEKDVAQAAVAIAGRAVAVEDARGTDALLDRVALLRRSGTLPKSGGVLVKCLKPRQDGRHDVPTIGPQTAERVVRAGLVGVAAEAGRAILVGKDETIEAFRRAGLFLFGMDAPPLRHD